MQNNKYNNFPLNPLRGSHLYTATIVLLSRLGPSGTRDALTSRTIPLGSALGRAHEHAQGKQMDGNGVGLQRA